MNRSIKDTIKVTQLLEPQAITADEESAGVDASQGEALQIAVHVGDFAFSPTNALSLRLQHSDVDVDGSYAAVVDADVFEDVGSNGQVALLDSTDDAETVQLFNYKGAKKFVRLAIVETGTVNCPMAVTALQGYLKAQGE
jgi:hypothetical protein